MKLTQLIQRISSASLRSLPWRRLAFVFGASLMVAISVSLVLLLVTYRASQSVPEFYAQQMQVETQQIQVAGAELEDEVIDWDKALQTDGTWTVAVSDDQINRWLAKELENKLPRLLPSYTSNPRIKINEDGALLACQYNNGRVSAVLSMAINAFVTDKPNEIGILIRNAKIGSVPGLTANAVEQLTWAGRRTRLPIRWLQKDGNPLAMVQIPQQVLDTRNEITVEDIEWREGRLVLTCKTRMRPQDDTATAARPIASHPSQMGRSLRDLLPKVRVTRKPVLASISHLRLDEPPTRPVTP